ncbi:MAG: FTR1 family protein [Nitrospirae bacterium]|nr:FTR1 family protein [Nitrospirota bacterium]
MFESFVITLREGMEAFLIVAISVGYLRKTGRGSLVRAVGWGAVASVLASVGAGVLLERALNQPLWEGVLAVAAALLVGTMTVHLAVAARTLKKRVESRLEAATRKPGPAAYAGLFLFTVLMVTREGMETALLLGSLLVQEGSTSVLAGALLGLFAAAGLAWLWSRYGHRVNLAHFFQVTAVFLFVFLVQLLIYGFHEITEAGVLPIERTLNDRLHWATEPFGPEGLYGQWLTYAMVMLPLAWLAWASLRDRMLPKAIAASGGHRPGFSDRKG